MNSLMQWAKARHALAEAQTIDEIKNFRDMAEAARLYAKQAGLGMEVQNYAAEFKLRAERRLGEVLKEMPKNKGAEGNPGGQGAKVVRSHAATAQPTLADIGISKSQSSRVQKVADVPEATFESHIEAVKSQNHEITTTELLRQAKKSQPKTPLDTPPLPDGEFDVLYADPPWQYNFSETESRKVERQYSTMTVDELCALSVPAGDPALLLLWATAPKLMEALQVMAAWGFGYKTHLIWDKKKIGMGYWVRGRHELLLICTRGHFSPPVEAERIESVFQEPRTRHSAKPTFFYDWIERSFPNRTYLELFARTTRPGWAHWGNEVGTSRE